MPQEDIIYFADFAHLPYGPRPRKEVEEFTLQAVDFFMSEDVKAFLIPSGKNRAIAAIPIISEKPSL
jgi:glutamate racemase